MKVEVFVEFAPNQKKRVRSSVEVGKNSKVRRFRVKFEVETRVRLRSILTCRIPGSMLLTNTSSMNQSPVATTFVSGFD